MTRCFVPVTRGRSAARGWRNFSDQYGANPGVTLDTSRNQALGNLGGTPLLFRNGNLGPAAFPPVPVYPMTDLVTQDVNFMDPNLQVPYADSWTARSAARDRPQHGG